MNYTVEDLSPVRKRVSVSVDKEEVNAALAVQLALYQKDGSTIQIPGYRKGKAPASALEARFHKEIYSAAKQDLFTAHINQVLQETGVEPLSGVEMGSEAEEPFVRNQPYSYTMEFDILPAFELPVYEGLSVEVNKASWNVEELLEKQLSRIQAQKATLKEVKDGTPQEGDGVTLDFHFLKPNGSLVHALGNVKNGKFRLNPQEMLSEFYDLVKSLHVGEEKQGAVTFPKDFLQEKFAGKTLTAVVKLKKIERLQLPELNDEFAKNYGKSVGASYENVEQLKDALREGQKKQAHQIEKQAAETKMVDDLLKQVDFPLPPGLLKMKLDGELRQVEEQMSRNGVATPPTEEIRKLYTPRAEYLTRVHVLLLAIAKKEGLQTTETELNQNIFEESLRLGYDFHRLRDFYAQSGLMPSVRDQILLDKASDLIYERAKVSLVEPEKKEESAKAESIDAPASESGTGEENRDQG